MSIRRSMDGPGAGESRPVEPLRFAHIHGKKAAFLDQMNRGRDAANLRQAARRQTQPDSRRPYRKLTSNHNYLKHVIGQVRAELGVSAKMPEIADLLEKDKDASF